MVPLVCASASARATDPSHIKEHWAAVSEPDTGRSGLFLLLASCVPLLVCCDSGDQRGSVRSSYLERRGSLFS